MDVKARLTNRVGNADLYIGMVRKRKSLPRDSKGFEPIEEYLKEVEEDLNQSSGDSDSGEETDVEEEKRKEEHEREVKRHVKEQERERRAAERRKREEEVRRAEEAKLERETQQREAERQKREEREHGNTEGISQKQGGKSVQQSHRRSLRQRGIASDTDERGSSSEAGASSEADVAVVSTRPPVQNPSDPLTLENESDGDGGGNDREKRKVTTSKRGRRSQKSVKKTAPEKETRGAGQVAEMETAEEGGVGEGVSVSDVTSGEGGAMGGGGGGKGRRGVDSANLFSPEVSVQTSPLRDTVKLGPVRLTFSASPSDDERRRQDGGDHTTLTTLTAKKQQQITQRTDVLPLTETTGSATAEKQAGSEKDGNVAEGEDAGMDGESRFKMTTVEEAFQSGSVFSHLEGSFHPKKTSTRVKGRRQGGKSAAKRVSGRQVNSVVSALESDSEDGVEGDEEDQELLSLLEPSAHVSRLVGLSQLTRPRKSVGERKPAAASVGRGGRRGSSSACGESTDEEHPPPAKSAVRSKQDKTRPAEKKSKKSAGRATGVASNTTILTKTSGKGKKKASRKSVAFNPHTTNLGSPELPPHTVASVATESAENPATESDTGGSSGVYDYVPSDEEDFSHTKSRLYSPRRTSILRKAAASMRKNKSTQQQNESKKRKGGAGDKTTGNDKEEVGQEVETEPGSGRAPKSQARTSAIRELSIQVEDISSRGQWFVPDELNMHKMISANSPRSLRRLTRFGRPPLSDTSTSALVVPPKRRQQRPRQLDSTIHNSQYEERRGENLNDTRKIGSASQNGEVSSADEGLTSSTYARRQVSNPVEQTTQSGRIPRSNKRSSRSAKLMSPRRTQNKKNTAPKSDRGQDDVDERTPVPKKQRVSPPEEDEGMQSGGAFLSSSEEEDMTNLVRSLGGRRYRRYVVEHQNTKTPGVRRSKRTRLAPVQHWRNEEPEYERRCSGITLKGVLVPLEETGRKTARRRKVPPATVEDGKTPQRLTLIDRHGVQEELDIVTHPSLCTMINGQGETASKSDEFIITKLHSSTSTSCGLIELRYLGEKERSMSTTHEVVFFVLKGRVRFLVDRQHFDLSAEAQIRIPAGVTYALRNMHRGLVRLYFHSHQVKNT